ncbi:hypothetical protein [Paraburkholderia sp. BCC1885]|uniref:hypothetical protein n=1 Tax=Paraburkholderia sp. BCC1885 TaxID=2562669 RepID=UPI00118362F8|nr:hypothetical protein [Paraburkholderia sp. BCC1885]
MGQQIVLVGRVAERGVGGYGGAPANDAGCDGVCAGSLTHRDAIAPCEIPMAAEDGVADLVAGSAHAQACTRWSAVHRPPGNVMGPVRPRSGIPFARYRDVVLWDEL